MTITFTHEHVGTLFDGAAGQAYNDTRLVALAVEHGYDTTYWVDSSDAHGGGQAGPSWSDLTQAEQEDHPHLQELADEALEHLNENACEDGVALEWVDGDLFVTAFRDYSVAEITVEAEDMGHVDSDHVSLETGGIIGLQCVRIGFPDTENGYTDTPRAFDWLNSLTVAFEANDGHETAYVYASTGDPRGAMIVATLTRRDDGSVTLTGPAASSVTSHEHYAKPVQFPSEAHAWRVR